MLAALSISDLMRGEIEASHRVRLWEQSLETMVAHPLTGAGLGNEVCATHHVTPNGERQRLNDPHETFLSIGAQSGLPALMAFMLLLVLVIRARRTLAPSLALGVGLCWILHGLSGSFEETRHVWALLGLLCVAETSGRLTGDTAFAPSDEPTSQQDA